MTHGRLVTSALRSTADTLLDAASYGARWVLLSPAPGAGVTQLANSAAPARRSGRAPPANLTFRLVGGPSQPAAWASGPGRAGGSCGNGHRRMFCDSYVTFLRLQRTAVATAVL